MAAAVRHLLVTCQTGVTSEYVYDGQGKDPQIQLEKFELSIMLLTFSGSENVKLHLSSHKEFVILSGNHHGQSEVEFVDLKSVDYKYEHGCRRT